MKKIRFNIDGYTIEAEEGQNLLQAALDAGIYIPHLCYHPDLTPQGGCKLCTVEIEGVEGTVQSCETIVAEGMQVKTKTEKVKHHRAVALELMLASHPKDCTSCDKYLNCELQALMQYMGVAHSRLREIDKENTRIIPSDQLIKREMYRCIQCGRCVRACQELRGIGALQYNKRGGETYIGTKDDVPLSETDCRFCGACVEVCPTGAIQDVKGVFAKDSPRNLALIPCTDKCPAHTDIPMYVRLAQQGKYSDAVSVFREKLTFPHSLGCVCTHTCESGCKRNHVNEAVSIRELKRFSVEHDKEESWKKRAFHNPPTGKKAAVIGGGAAGMTAAYYLAKKGHEVTVFERQPMAGGMLSYGIPKYRLPQDIVNQELETLVEVGIKMVPNTNVASVDEVFAKGFDAVLVSVGAQKGKRPPAYSGNWKNALDAVDFCRLANEGNLPDLGETLTVYGGGNVAFDCARTAKMKGVSTVRVVCLEPRDKMLADKEEVTCALAEGIEILNSKSMLGLEETSTDTEGKKTGLNADTVLDAVTGLKLINVVSFRFGDKGLELETEEGSETVLKTDTLVFATGQQPGLTEAFGIDLQRGSVAKTNDALGTGKEGVFAAGDAVTGTKSVVDAIESGRRAAMSIDSYLGGDGNIEEVLYDREKQNPRIGTVENFAALKRAEQLCGECDAAGEALRCLQCDLRLDIQKVKYWVDAHYKQVKEAAE
ncbi:FAD-dependent oxidoreductase [Anoxybacterium hadale]|uniref:FAD-dependent oxidoreductase n=1 Tax=Anoxybacterium hadale TaxID=3408580 RepID=A0ACD1AE81_9FIRM|nr:FAD-dependent oxidoreductase [Clostridiales bacterium]